MKYFLTFSFLIILITGHGQDQYKDSLARYLDDYVANHEVVAGDDKKKMTFYPVDRHMRITARFEKVNDGKWFQMETSANLKQTFRTVGILHFTIHDTLVKLNVYQSQNLMLVSKYKDLLFLPFTDLSSGEDSYENGRYIDLYTTDVVNDQLIIDFNKAYNPYCAYISGKYNCPVPPKENQLPVAIHAGEMKFNKTATGH